jgi:hypothetical protein
MRCERTIAGRAFATGCPPECDSVPTAWAPSVMLLLRLLQARPERRNDLSARVPPQSVQRGS